ncbi:MAG TPA: glycosyltransferase [Candidatus Elarobacter sp.]
MVVSVVTPALDAGRFIERTLSSVASQTYRDVEHIVVDGGSRDRTAELVRESDARLLVVPGLRQAEAVNRGVAETRGELVVVLNADDVLEPDGIAALVTALAHEPDAVAAYGEALHVAADDAVISRYPTESFDPHALRERCYICQPAAAVRRTAFDAVGGMDARLDVAMDYDFWIRLARYGRFVHTEALVARSRMHEDNKTLARRGEVYREVIGILRRRYGYVPYGWAYAYASWLLHRGDQFFTPPPRSRIAVLFALALGVALNPLQPLRSVRDWYGHRTVARGR